MAVYWKTNSDKQTKVIAIDLYDRVADNLAAIAATLAAMRAKERHGGAMILERAFLGFTALPVPKKWREVLGVSGVTTPLEIKAIYRGLALKAHPDKGGSHEAMAELNRAYQEAEKELGGAKL